MSRKFTHTMLFLVYFYLFILKFNLSGHWILFFVCVRLVNFTGVSMLSYTMELNWKKMIEKKLIQCHGNSNLQLKIYCLYHPVILS